MMFAALMLSVSGCSTGKPLIKAELSRPALPPSSLMPCAKPQRLPENGLSLSQAADYWARDRSSLLSCERKREAAVKAVSQAAQDKAGNINGSGSRAAV